eukprot:241551-Prymnesium_polylepis.1
MSVERVIRFLGLPIGLAEPFHDRFVAAIVVQLLHEGAEPFESQGFPVKVSDAFECANQVTDASPCDRIQPKPIRCIQRFGHPASAVDEKEGEAKLTWEPFTQVRDKTTRHRHARPEDVSAANLQEIPEMLVDDLLLLIAGIAQQLAKGASFLELASRSDCLHAQHFQLAGEFVIGVGQWVPHVFQIAIKRCAGQPTREYLTVPGPTHPAAA